MVMDIQKMVKRILANQENSQDHHHHNKHDHHINNHDHLNNHDHQNNLNHHIHLRQIPSTPPLVQHVPHPQNLSPYYAEGETVRRTGFVRWPEEQDEDNMNANSDISWEDFALEYAALNNINNNIGDGNKSVNDDDKYTTENKDIENAPNESPNNVIGPNILQKESLKINKFFR